MTDSSPADVFKAFIDAFAARDFDRLRRCLANEGFTYKSPISRFDNATEFVKDLYRIGQILEGIQTRHIFVDGNDVCAILNFKIRINIVDITPVVLWSTVENGRIKRQEAFFDATEYSQMFPDQAG